MNIVIVGYSCSYGTFYDVFMDILIIMVMVETFCSVEFMASRLLGLISGRGIYSDGWQYERNKSDPW